MGSAGDGRLVRAAAEGAADAPAQLGEQVARALLDAGAGALLPPRAP